MAGAGQHDAFASASSSSHSPPADTPTSADDHDEIDFLDDDDDDDDGGVASIRGPYDQDVLEDDPIHGNLGAPLSFKRKQKSSLLAVPAQIFSTLTGRNRSSRRGQNSPLRRPSPTLAGPARPWNGNGSGNVNVGAKDGAPLDWYVEGPGRRVGYEDLTAIDWIFEYNKERRRLRVLSSGAGGLMGYAQHFLDGSQVWIILLLTGLSVGAIAAGINIATDWLGDLKLGYCSSGPEGGQFYLNRAFCCLGYDQGSKCVGWKTWGEAMGVQAAGGIWTVGYIFFLLFSVCQGHSFLYTARACLPTNAGVRSR